MEKQLVPSLRFPSNIDNWDKVILEDITSKISDGIHSTPKYDLNGDYYFVNGNNLVDGIITINENTKKLSLEEFKKHKRSLNKNSILLSINGTIGNLAFYNNEKIVLGKSACYINFHKDLPIDFYYYILQTPRIKKYILSELTGSTIMNLSLRTIKSTKLIVPSLSEQQKIASFLTDVDLVITKLTKKKTLLEQYKKGVMQNIFNQELSFKDDEGNEFPQWRTGRIDEFGYFYYGKSAPKFSLSKDAPTPCVRYGELYSTYDEVVEKIQSYTNIEPSNLKFSKGGEVLVPRVGEDPLDFANCSYLPIPNVAIGEMISVYNTKENGLFMTYYFNANLKHKFARVVEGANVSNLYFKYLEDIEIEIPSIEEQTKIVSFLSDITRKIDALNIKTFKKGLLQQMFV